MPWKHYAHFSAGYYRNGIEHDGPCSAKRWFYGPGERGKKHRLSYRWRPPAWSDHSDSIWRDKAIAYAQWLARRDGVNLPAIDKLTRPEWSGVYSATRKGAKGREIYERRIEAVLWGHEIDVYNTQEDGRRGAWLRKDFVTTFRFPLPHWDFNPEYPQEETDAA